MWLLRKKREEKEKLKKLKKTKKKKRMYLKLKQYQSSPEKEKPEESPRLVKVQKLIDKIEKVNKESKDLVKTNEETEKRLDKISMLQLFNFNPIGLKDCITETAMEVFQKRNRPLKFNPQVKSKLKMAVILESKGLPGCYRLIRDNSMSNRFVKEIMLNLNTNDKPNVFEETDRIMKEYGKAINKYTKKSIFQKVTFPDGTVYMIVKDLKEENPEDIINNLDKFLAKLRKIKNREIFIEEQVFKYYLQSLKFEFDRMCEEKKFVVFKTKKKILKSNKKKSKSVRLDRRRNKSTLSSIMNSQISNRKKHGKQILRSIKRDTKSMTRKLNLKKSKNKDILNMISRIHSPKKSRNKLSIKSINDIKNETRKEMEAFFNQKMEIKTKTFDMRQKGFMNIGSLTDLAKKKIEFGTTPIIERKNFDDSPQKRKKMFKRMATFSSSSHALQFQKKKPDEGILISPIGNHRKTLKSQKSELPMSFKQSQLRSIKSFCLRPIDSVMGDEEGDLVI